MKKNHATYRKSKRGDSHLRPLLRSLTFNSIYLVSAAKVDISFHISYTLGRFFDKKNHSTLIEYPSYLS